jgi:predicted ATPase
MFDAKYEANVSLGASAATQFNEMFCGRQGVEVFRRFRE